MAVPRNKEQRTEDGKAKLRSIGIRLIILLALVVGALVLTYRNSPLNLLNLFSKPVHDQETVERVRKQESPPPAPETMHQVEIAGQVLTLPSELTISVFAAGRGKLRMIAQTHDQFLLVTEKDRGNVLAYPLSGASPEPIVIASGLSKPSGITFHDGFVWVAEETRVVKFKYLGTGKVDSKEVVIAGIPSGGHDTRTVGFGPDGKQYVAIGSSCNVCEEKDRRRAAIVRYNADGTGEEIFAEGLRNTVPFVWHPETGEMWSVDNGRDLIGDDLPPEEVNIIREGKHYGWPYCYGRGVANPEYPDKKEFCQSTQFPIVEMQAHSAPLGIRFYEGGNWPDRYDGSFFVGFHGSWNRSVPTGYKIVRVDKDLKVHDFITGWLNESTGKAWGRPVDVFFVGDDLFITDDAGGRIFKITLDQ